MYEYISGKLTEKNPAYAVVESNGVGFFLNISLQTFTALSEGEQKGEYCKLYTHLVVREDALILYGFTDKKERELFRHLISVNGVGANTARMILSSLNTTEVYEAILQEQTGTLKSVKGIGAKSAQRIILDLKDKLKKDQSDVDILESGYNTKRTEALSALTMLGFQESAAEKVLSKILKSVPPDSSVEEIIKEALKAL
ncbi:MAG: Holliday junction branch migration protein RuvA [Bacteroidales bacterium]|nr:Holliday junction branch migration protein RuvA [Bacteroidales bacterium]MCF8327292.1 Holliday junction branch migration protein RuvA [Bacteroidales bacterium]